MVDAHHRTDNRDVIAQILWEQRTDRAVNHAAGESCLFCRPALALQIGTWDFANRIHFLFIIYGKREKIHAVTGLC